LGYAILILLLTSIPYVIAFQATSSQTPVRLWSFSGFLFGVEDGNSYIAKMRRGMEGEWLFRSPYSGMEQRGLLAFFPYYLLGKLAGGTASHEQLVILFHWFRIGASLLCVYATYLFLREFLESVFFKRVALVVITLGGGLGWIALLFQTNAFLPLEFFSPEAFGFLSLYGLPHLSLARALLLFALVEYLHLWRDTDKRKRNSIIWRLGLFWLGAGLSQPIHAGILAIVIFLHLAAMVIVSRLNSYRKPDWRDVKRIIPSVILASLPVLILLAYTSVGFFTEPYLKIWALQNRLPTPHISLYLLSYGWLVPLLIGGVYRARLLNREKRLLLFIWMGSAFVLIFTPISIQRRLIEGVWVVIIVFSFLFLESLSAALRQWSRQIGLILLLFSLPSSFILLAGGIRSGMSFSTPIFFPAGHVAGLEFLNQQREAKNAIVLASYQTSNALPAYAFVRVIIGHGPESPNNDVIAEDVERFFQAKTPDSFRREFIRQHRIDYIIWGAAEKELGDWQPSLESYLTPLYENQELTIFEVVRAKITP